MENDLILALGDEDLILYNVEGEGYVEGGMIRITYSSGNLVFHQFYLEELGYGDFTFYATTSAGIFEIQLNIHDTRKSHICCLRRKSILRPVSMSFSILCYMMVCFPVYPETALPKLIILVEGSRLDHPRELHRFYLPARCRANRIDSRLHVKRQRQYHHRLFVYPSPLILFIWLSSSR
ncbi:MAG: hypothetical protein MZU97_01070 [Bacillus subtilis]|nr:hypothetical protein [Bacillus subtilis]